MGPHGFLVVIAGGAILGAAGMWARHNLHRLERWVGGERPNLWRADTGFTQQSNVTVIRKGEA